MKLEKSKNPLKKYDAVFDDGRRISFGGVRRDGTPYDDYTLGASDQKREAYLKRHSAMEDFENPYTAGSLAAWILWGSTRSVQKNLDAYRKHFHLE